MLRALRIRVVPVGDLQRLFVFVFLLNFDFKNNENLSINDSDTLNVCCFYVWNQVMLYC